MKITINEIRSIIKEELQNFLKKEKDTCREEYLECGDTVPCFDKYLECEEDAVFRGVKAFRADKIEKAEFARMEKEKQAEFARMEKEKQAELARIEKEKQAELARIEKEKQAEFERMHREEQERIAKGIYRLYKFVDEQGGRVSRDDVPDELYQFLSTAEMEGNIADVSDEFEAYSLGDAPGGYEERKKLIQMIKKQYSAEDAKRYEIDRGIIPGWAVEEEDGKYYWYDQEFEEKPIEVPEDLIDFYSS